MSEMFFENLYRLIPHFEVQKYGTNSNETAATTQILMLLKDLFGILFCSLSRRPQVSQFGERYCALHFVMQIFIIRFQVLVLVFVFLGFKVKRQKVGVAINNNFRLIPPSKPPFLGVGKAPDSVKKVLWYTITTLCQSSIKNISLFKC